MSVFLFLPGRPIDTELEQTEAFVSQILCVPSSSRCRCSIWSFKVCFLGCVLRMLLGTCVQWCIFWACHWQRCRVTWPHKMTLFKNLDMETVSLHIDKMQICLVPHPPSPTFPFTLHATPCLKVSSFASTKHPTFSFKFLLQVLLLCEYSWLWFPHISHVSVPMCGKKHDHVDWEGKKT